MKLRLESGGMSKDAGKRLSRIARTCSGKGRAKSRPGGAGASLLQRTLSCDLAQAAAYLAQAVVFLYKAGRRVTGPCRRPKLGVSAGFELLSETGQLSNPSV